MVEGAVRVGKMERLLLLTIREARMGREKCHEGVNASTPQVG